MKSKKTPSTGSGPSGKGGSEPKAKLKIKNLKLAKETIENLSDQDAGAVKGGGGSRNGSSGEAGGGVLVAQCWVARAVYGEDNHRWRLFRAWLLEDAPAWFRNLYVRHGERFAGWIAPHPFIKSAIRCWMDSRINGRHRVYFATVVQAGRAGTKRFA